MFRHALRATTICRLSPCRGSELTRLVPPTVRATLSASRHGVHRSWLSIPPPLGKGIRVASIHGFASSRHETIYALSSAQGRAGIAVIRISGPRCLDVSNRSPVLFMHLNGIDIKGVGKRYIARYVQVVLFPNPDTQRYGLCGIPASGRTRI